MSLIKKLTPVFIAGSIALTSSISAYPSFALEDSGIDYDFARALQYSIYFYDANMCGKEVSENTQYSWRGDCHTYDSQVAMNSNATNLSESFLTKYKDILDPDGDGFIDVSGGFHDAGDHVKFGIPENYAASTLGWGYYEFRDSYKKLGQDKHIETILRYFNDYLMKCTFRDENGEVIAHCYQVGDGDIDHDYWNSPEIDEMERPAFFLTGDKPQTDYAASAAASLAANYMNFKDTDSEYAEKSLDYAKALFSFARNHEKQLSDNADGPKQYYRSEKWEDDYVWAAAWLYKATEDISYLNEAAKYIDYYAPSGWAHCWNDVWSGAITLLGEIDLEHPEIDLQNIYRKAQNKSEYEDADFWIQIEKAIQKWMTGYNTPAGYAFLNEWGSARYNTAMQLVTLVYDKYKNNGKPSGYSDWAKGQMEYLMGNNPMDTCYIVGYNDKTVKHPHHRASSGLTTAEDTKDHRYVLYGALVGGPDGSDKYTDVTAKYVYTEVTIDYNAAFVGACAGLYAFYGTDDMKITPDFPPAVSSEGEQGGNNYWVNACGIDDLNSDGCGVTKVSLVVMTDSTKPAKDISVRYYFNSSEISDVNNVKPSELYDQAAVEAAPADGIISGPYKYDKTDDTYYVEIRWDGYTIANSNKKYQFTVGMYYGDKWNPENDPSYKDLKIYDTDSAFFGMGNEVKTDNICVYSDGVLVGGIEPDGSVPETTEATTAPETSSSANIIWGDVNSDGKVEIADVVSAAAYVGDQKNNTIEPQGLINGDVHNTGDGITSGDVLAIQQYLAQIVKKLPV